MSSNLKIVIALVSVFLLFITLRFVKKGKIPIKYSLVWLFSSIILLFVTLFPFVFEQITNLLGFQVSSNLVIGILLMFLLLITLMLTVIVAEQNKKIILLIQELSILKKDNSNK